MYTPFWSFSNIDLRIFAIRFTIYSIYSIDCLIKSLTTIYCMDALNTEIRRVQALQGERSLTLVLPKVFAIRLGIGKGDFLKCCIEDNRLIVEKADF